MSVLVLNLLEEFTEFTVKHFIALTYTNIIHNTNSIFNNFLHFMWPVGRDRGMVSSLWQTIYINRQEKKILGKSTHLIGLCLITLGRENSFGPLRYNLVTFWMNLENGPGLTHGWAGKSDNPSVYVF